MIKAETLIRISKEEAAIIMRKKSEIQKENEEFVKTYDDSKYPKPSVTVDIVIFGMFDLKEDNYRKISEKKLKVLLIQRGEAPYEGCYALPGGFVHPEEGVMSSFGSSFLDDMIMYFKKDTDFQMIKHKKFFKKLNREINKVYSYGFSYGKVDAVYIKRIINNISSNATWYFTKYEAENSEELRIKKVKLRNYGFKGSFGIY